MKALNMIGHALMRWKKWFQAYNYFKKLADVAKMGCDLETTLYSFK